MRVKAASQITPLILAYNEEPNIGRALESLRWAERVIVLDSCSTDKTEMIARRFGNVDWHTRPFDNFGNQWDYGIRQTGITSEYILALNADMSTKTEFVKELENSFLPNHFAGGIIPFEYRIEGKSLISSILPPRLMIFKRSKVRVSQPGHTEVFEIDGETYHFRTPLIHDDRKTLERWVFSQLSYSDREAERLLKGNSTRLQDRLRKFGVMPVVAGAVAYLRAGGPLRGAAAARYAYERAVYECLLAIRLMNKRLEAKDSPEE